MKTARWTLAAVVLGGLHPTCSAAESKKTPDQIYISLEAAQALVETDYHADPDKAAGPKKLRDWIAERKKVAKYAAHPNEISIAELQAIRSGEPTEHPKPGKKELQGGDVPRDAYGLPEIRRRFEAQEGLNRAQGKGTPTAKDYEARLGALALPGSTWFTIKQVQAAEKYDPRPPANASQRESAAQEDRNFAALEGAYHDVQAAAIQRTQGLRSPHLRRTWSDVLYDEDASIDPTATDPTKKRKAISDLEGAQFAYTRNDRANTDTWTAHAAVIWPVTYSWNLDRPVYVDQLAFAPSVTYDRVSTSGDPKTEVNSLLFRGGLYLDIFGLYQPERVTVERVRDPNFDPLKIPPFLQYGLQVRAAAIYATDEDLKASAPGFEADFEPRFLYERLGLGYEMNLWEKKPARTDGKDNSFLTAQLRLWLHTEGGHVQDASQSWVQSRGTFFRLGPTTQLTLAAPALPGYRTLSLTAIYSRLEAVVGPSNRPSYFRFTLAYDLFRDPELNHKVGISASYERGGLSFTKQEVNDFSLGLSVLF